MRSAGREYFYPRVAASLHHAGTPPVVREVHRCRFVGEVSLPSPVASFVATPLCAIGCLWDSSPAPRSSVRFVVVTAGFPVRRFVAAVTGDDVVSCVIYFNLFLYFGGFRFNCFAGWVLTIFFVCQDLKTGMDPTNKLLVHPPSDPITVHVCIYVATGWSGENGLVVGRRSTSWMHALGASRLLFTLCVRSIETGLVFWTDVLRQCINFKTNLNTIILEYIKSLCRIPWSHLYDHRFF